MFDNLIDNIQSSLQKVSGRSKISENNISETLKEVRKSLVNADVNYKLANSFTERVKEKAIGQKIHLTVSPGQLFTKIFRDELADLMGERNEAISLKGNPNTIMVCGLQGSGKTTFCSKLAQQLKNKDQRKVLLVACDVYRPAAVEQLKTLGEKIEVEVFSIEGSTNVKTIASKAKKHALKNAFTTVIVDTAGRLAIDEEMMKEIVGLKKEITPNEILFVADAMTGQDAVITAAEFNNKLNFDGVVLSKMDGDARGGAALSIKAETGKPIKFVSVGETPDSLEQFHPDRMAERILGMGDVLTLVEKAQEQFDEKEAKKLEKKFKKNKFDYEDLLKQMRAVKKMGNIKDLMGMIPGVGGKLKNTEIDEKPLKIMENIILSMTLDERSCKVDLNLPRKERIAKGSGTRVEDVSKLTKNLKEMKKIMKMTSQGRVNFGGLMNKMQGK